jgi:hypothetical protein
VSFESYIAPAGLIAVPLTAGKMAVIDLKDADRVLKHKWHFSGHGYAATGIDGKRVYLHRLIVNARAGQLVDHKNHDGLDNRRCNLRIASKVQNSQNRLLVRGSSKFKGVCLNKRKRKWIAGIRVNTKSYHLGYFKNEEDAAIAYNVAAQLFFNEFASLNPV